MNIGEIMDRIVAIDAERERLSERWEALSEERKKLSALLGETPPPACEAVVTAEMSGFRKKGKHE
jgi:seryl-tRNA synthetase